jgi:hypothetical protein
MKSEFKRTYENMKDEEHVGCHFVDDLCGELQMNITNNKYLSTGEDGYWIEQLTMENGDLYNCYIYLTQVNGYRDGDYECIAEKQ